MADTYNTIVKNSRSIGPASGDGAATRILYPGDNATTWAAGQLLLFASGVLSRILSTATGVVAGYLDTDDIAAGAILMQATEALAAASTDEQPVKRVKWDTIFEGPLVSSTGAQATPPTAPTTIVGTKYGLLQDASGNWAVDKSITSKQLVEIVAVESQFRPFNDSSLYVHSAADPQRYNFVRFKFLDSVISNE